ncbi:murein L,D-transpeptidase family protein [Devosia sp.]|uniref:murein L,D-transpeptidase family protein n=1 Tax=Devosia sp. TaxID=1871048 RepID=UPI0032638158
MTLALLKKLCSFLVLTWIAVSLAACGNFLPGDNKSNQPLSGSLQSALRSIGSTPGDPMVVRIFKEDKTLEVWKRTNTGAFKMLKSYEICAFSGDFGPKIKEGDRQSPEGFYNITPGLLNPKSSYYLSFNTGFPNKFDRSWGRTGSELMVHGDCSSRGCYAMTDEGIAEIYALARETFKGGNPTFQLQIFPFHMTAAKLAKENTSTNLAFWKNIKEGYDLFELNKTPAAWDVCERKYVFNVNSAAPLDAVGACPVIAKDQTLLAKQAADEAAFASQVEGIQKDEARAAADAAQKVADDAAAKARGEAINSTVNNVFGGIGGLFGKHEDVAPVMSGKPAPMPMPPLNRT